MIYECTVLIDASTGFTVEADTPEEAAEKAELLAAEEGAGSLCRQCSNHTSTGDFYAVRVYCDGSEVLDTDFQSQQLAESKAREETLRAQVAERDELIGVMLARLSKAQIFGYDRNVKALSASAEPSKVRAIPAEIAELALELSKGKSPEQVKREVDEAIASFSKGSAQ